MTGSYRFGISSNIIVIVIIIDIILLASYNTYKNINRRNVISIHHAVKVGGVSPFLGGVLTP